MSADAKDRLLAYFPIWGATFDSEETGFVGENVQAYTPYHDEWKYIQQTDVSMEQAPGSLEGPSPPLCLVVVEQLKEGESGADAFMRLRRAMFQSADAAVLALRLSKAGWFLEPKFAETVFTSGGFNYRFAGCYRQAFLKGMPENIPTGYKLSIRDLTIQQNDVRPITKTFQLVRRYREWKPHASADIAIENFNRSYGYQLPGMARAAFLFTALDAMFGGMTHASIQGVRKGFLDRVTAALRAIEAELPCGTLNAREEAGWLDSGSNGGRKIRNAIAHGRPSTVAEEAESAWERIQSIVRLLLRQFLEFSVKWANLRVPISKRLHIPSDYAPVAAYNCVVQSSSAADLLRFSLSA